jgi:hypothetical protein
MPVFMQWMFVLALVIALGLGVWIGFSIAHNSQPKAVREEPTDNIFADGIVLQVVGESHSNPDGTERQIIISKLKAGEMVRLVREPGNPYDPHAIRVDTPGGTLGYIARETAKDMASRMDSGMRCEACISTIAGGTADKPNRGVWLSVQELS